MAILFNLTQNASQVSTISEGEACIKNKRRVFTYMLDQRSDEELE
jgi:hypothetical protein